jgi:dTDP-glucose 4,6-dehydratase
MSRILITGGAGFIGSNLVRRMVNQGHEVLNLDKLTYAGNLTSLSDLAGASNYRFLQADIVDANAVGNAIESFQPTAIMHLAAESHVDRSIDGPREFINTNVGGTLNLLLASLAYWRNLPETAKPSFRFLHVSTDEVYGSLGPTGLFTEETRYDPHSPYSASKAASDHLVRAWHDTYGLPVLITNCSNNYGPFQFPEKLIPVVILKCLKGESIPVYGKGENVRDWLFVDDHCEALDLVTCIGKTGQTYNIGGNNEIRNIDLVRTICRLMDDLKPTETPYEKLITFVSDRPGHDLRYAIDSTKIQRELGWRPTQDRDSGLRRTVNWYIENQEWCQRILSGNYRLQRLGQLS